jgi:chaperonin GroEL
MISSKDITEGHINLVDHETFKKIVRDVLRDVGSVRSTLGPGGKANLVHDSNNMSLYKSKDGFRDIMDMHYDDYFYDAVLKLIKDVSAYNNAIIGDSTTSAAVILEKFYIQLEDLVEAHNDGFKYISLTGVVNILESLKVVLKEELKTKGYVQFLNDYPLEEQKKIVRKVATIAANNDKTVGDYVAKRFDKIIESGNADELFVDITPNYSKDTSESSEIGFRMMHSYIDRIYTTEPDGATAIYENPRFLIIEGALIEKDIETIRDIVDYVCFLNGAPLVIIASEFTKPVAQWLYSLRLGGQKREFFDKQMNRNRTCILPPFSIIPIEISAGDDESHDRYVDLETALGGRAIPAITQTWDSLGTTAEEWEKILGGAEKITCIPFETSIMGGKGDKKKIDARIEKLQNELDHMIMISDGGASELRKASYQERIGLLKSNMVSIRVGGATFKERQYNCLVYEDAVYALKSTIKNGFTLAGQVSLIHLIRHHSDEIVEKVISKLETEGRNVTFGKHRDEALKAAIKSILDVISETFTVAYETALENAIFDKNELEEIKKTIYDEANEKPMSYNLITGEYETLALKSDCNMLVAGNTDYETFASNVGIASLFLNVDNLETLYIPRRLTKEEILAKQLEGENK